MRMLNNIKNQDDFTNFIKSKKEYMLFSLAILENLHNATTKKELLYIASKNYKDVFYLNADKNKFYELFYELSYIEEEPTQDIFGNTSFCLKASIDFVALGFELEKELFKQEEGY